MAELDPQLEAQFGAAARVVTAASSATSSAQDRLQDQRDWIAKRIIQVLMYSVAAVLVICLAEGLRAQWSSAAEHAADLIKSTVLPVVTLVLGYYFGQASKP